MQKWRFKLSEYDYTVIHKPGGQNANADALSRNPIEPIPINAITRAQKNKPSRQKIRVEVQATLPDIISNKEPDGQETEARYPTRNREKPNYAESEISSEPEPDGRPLISEEPTGSDIPLAYRVALRRTSDSVRGNNETESEGSEGNDPAIRKFIVTCNEQFQFRTGNIIFFLEENGTPCDEGAKGLLEANRISGDQALETGEVR